MLKNYSVMQRENLRKKIKDKFDHLTPNSRYPLEINGEIIGYVFVYGTSYGVVIDNPNNFKINESFNAIDFKTINYIIDDNANNSIGLFCYDRKLSSSFANICSVFVIDDRENVQTDPYKWYNEWKIMIGNTFSEKRGYDILGEILAYKYYKKIDDSFVWDIKEFKNHDISGKIYDVEVKSSLNKYRNEIHISSQFQLQNKKSEPLRLMYIKFEKDDNGISLEDVVNDFPKEEKEKFISNIEIMGIKRDSKVYKEKYTVICSKEYIIDAKFPKIDDNSFENNVLPYGISKIEYVVDLNCIEGKNISIE